MSKNKRSKYARRTSVSIRRSEKLPIIIKLAVFLLVVLVAAVIVGNILLKKADSYTPEDERYTREPEELLIPTHDVEKVNAHAYAFGTSPESYIYAGVKDLSVCLRDAEGKISYDSAVGGLMGIDATSEVDLKASIDDLHESGMNVCAYIYLNFLSESDIDARIMRAYGISLIEEAVAAGVDDILLLGLDVNEDNVGRTVELLEEIKEFSGDTYIGVALDCITVMKAEEDIYLAGKLSRICDYIALDLTAEALPELRDPEDLSSDASEDISEKPAEDGADTEIASDGENVDAFSMLLDEMHYYIVGFDMRLVFDSDSVDNYEMAGELGYGNRQIVD